jgi:hypothetical protein
MDTLRGNKSMKKMIVMFIVLGLSMAGCAMKLKGFPKDADGCADVVVIREIAMMYAVGANPVVLDGFEIARIGLGQYVRFKLPPGNHSIGTMFNSLSIDFKCGEKYYFLQSPVLFSGFMITRLTEEQAQHLLSLNQPDYHYEELK